MADDHSQRPFRNTDLSTRIAPAAGNQPAGSNDPLAELARLIGQNDPFGEFGREEARQPATPPLSPRETEPMLRALAAQIPPQALHPGPGQASEPQAGIPTEEYARQAYGSAPLGDEVYQTSGTAPGYEEYAGGEGGYEGAGYDPNMPPPYAGDGQAFYDDIPPPRRRMGVLAIAAVFALAIVGTAGAFGYRALFGSAGSGPPPVIKADTAPSKVAPDNDKELSAKLINDRVGDPSGGQKLVSREERPVDLNRDPPAGMLTQDQAMTGAGSMQSPSLGSGVIGSDPKKIKTITIRPDQAGVVGAGTAAPPPQANVADATPPEEPEAAPPAARESASPPASRRTATNRPAPAPRRVASASSNAPLSLNPDAVPAPAPAPARTASAPTPLSPSETAAPARGGGYAVQVSSRRSEADAQAALQRMQGQYANVIGGQNAMVRRVDLGAKGIYYRAMVGPFGSSEEANRVCSQLKAAGGSCFVQRI